MRRIFYSSGSMLTGDVMCKAVFRYARALAETEDAAIVAIPVITEDGNMGFAHLLIGPASQLFSMPVSSDQEDPFDADIAADLDKKVRELQPSRATTPTSMDDLIDLSNLDIT